jgi:hypothetical protein
VKSTNGAPKSYFRSDEHVRVTWSGFEDPESKIEKYVILVVNNNKEILNYTRPSADAELEVWIATNLLSPKEAYRIVVKSFNYACLESSVISEQFSIDNTPPIYTGNKDELPRRYILPYPH